MELKDVIHYYIGCDCRIDGDNDTWHITGVDYAKFMIKVYSFTHDLYNFFDLSKVTPILRTIDSLTEDEKQTWRKLQNEVINHTLEVISRDNRDADLKDEGIVLWDDSYKTEAKIIHWMCSIGIDLFGLIESGIAININK